MKQNIQHRIVVILTCTAAFLLGAVGGAAMAGEVYSWTDENGVIHFGDRSPAGQDVRTIDIPETRSSGLSEAKVSPQSAPPLNDINAPGEPDAAPRSLADQKRDQMAKDRKEHREISEENERECARHRQRLTQMEPARRVFYTDEKGQTVRMDDVERVKLVEEDKDFIAKHCK